jgi:hypothetical protein
MLCHVRVDSLSVHRKLRSISRSLFCSAGSSEMKGVVGAFQFLIDLSGIDMEKEITG